MFRNKIVWLGMLAVLPLSQYAAAVEDDKWADFISQGPQTSSPQAGSAAALEPGGSLLINDKPSAQELLDRAKYWDSRGRRDLASRVRKPAASTGSLSQSVAPLAAISRDDAAPELPDNARSGVKPLEPVDRAKYWEARGRSDLAAKAGHEAQRADAATKVAATTAIKPSAIVISAAQASVTPTESGELTPPARVMPSTQKISDSAQYWEARGRRDLAVQLRQKLQVPDPVAISGGSGRVVPESMQSPPLRSEKDTYNQDAARTALEDSLIKNPNSLKARLDLAQIYRSVGETDKARAQLEKIQLASPDLPEVLYASAQLFAEQRLWRETLHALEKISPASRTFDMARLQKRAWAHVQLDRADALVRQGHNDEAEILLRQVAAELAVNDNQMSEPEPPPLWKSAVSKNHKARR